MSISNKKDAAEYNAPNGLKNFLNTIIDGEDFIAAEVASCLMWYYHNYCHKETLGTDLVDLLGAAIGYPDHFDSLPLTKKPAHLYDPPMPEFSSRKGMLFLMDNLVKIRSNIVTGGLTYKDRDTKEFPSKFAEITSKYFYHQNSEYFGHAASGILLLLLDRLLGNSLWELNDKELVGALQESRESERSIKHTREQEEFREGVQKLMDKDPLWQIIKKHN